jgi:hypothetical protein
MAGDRPALLGLLLYLAIAVAPTVLFWAVLRGVPAACNVLEGRRRARSPAPLRFPLDRQVADLRRLRGRVRARRPATHVRRVALQAAYDDALLAVCDQAGVEAPLAGTLGRERAYARLQTEAALEDAGIVIDPPSDGPAAA